MPVRIGTLGQQQLNDFRVTLSCRCHQRCYALPVVFVLIGARLEERLGNLDP